MKKIYYFLFLCGTLLSSTEAIYASHAAGGELTYEHVSGNTYRFTFKLFRDCTGISEPSSIPLCVYNLCTNTNVSTLYLPKIAGNIPGTSTPNGTPTSTGCPGFQTSCQNPSSQVEGYAEWWYQGTYILPTPGNTCDQWRFNTYIGSRNPSDNINGGNLYLEAFLNRRPVAMAPAIDNNSPVFTNAPIPYYCANQPTTFNNGTQEIDNDSLRFQSITPMNQFGCTHVTPSNCTYSNASYNPTTNPFNTGNTFVVNPAIGTINFTPNGTQVATISVRVNEYRNGVLIGYVMRDIQMVILNCTTPNPVFAIDTTTISGGFQTPSGIDICTGQNFNVCFDINSSSPTAILTVSDNSASQVSGSSMSYTGINTNNINGCFNWTPSLADTGLHIITITTIDSACAPPGVLITQVFTLALNVHQSIPLTVTSVNPVCGINNGSINVSAPGLNIYVLQPNNTTSTTGAFTGLGSGIYTVSVQNGGVCAVPQTINLSPPTNMSWSNVSSFNPYCSPSNNGSIAAQVTNGVGAINYVITPNVVPSNATGNFSGLGPGTYIISATDALNCTINTQVTLTAPLPLVLSSPVIAHPSCPSLSNGSITTLATNSSNPPITYSISPGTATNNLGVFTGLAPSVYVITATDAAGCTGTTSASVNSPILPIITGVNTGQPTCTALGSIFVNAFSVFMTPLTFNLQPSNVTNNTGLFLSLSANTYTISVTDLQGCTVDTTVVLNPVTNVITTAIASSGNCSTLGSIQANATGGVPTYSFNLMPGNLNNTSGSFSNLASGTYTVLVTDANSCTGTTIVSISNPQLPTWTSATSGNPNCNSGAGWVNGSAASVNAPMTYTLMPGSTTNSTGYFTNLAAGNYTLIASDNLNCDTTTSFIITVPAPMVWDSVSQTNVSCYGDNDGSLSVSSSGGTGMITYVLNPGLQSNTSGMYGTLIAGTYTITATDANNCSITTSITISEPPALQWGNPVTTNVSCNGGSDGTVSIVATGGTPTLSYTLQPGAVTNSGGSFTSLSQGSYTITVSDANNCTLSTTISITEPPVLNITNVSSTTPSCVPGNDGSLTITAVGGTPAYQYNIGLGNQGSNTFSNLGGGIYTITVADGNGCTATSTVSIIAPNAPNITTAQLTAVSCNGGSDGTISLTTTGGSAPLSYNLQAGNITNGTGFYTNLSANSYTITVTDGIGCSISTIVNITEPTAVQWDSVSQTNVSCYGDNDGSLSVSSSGGTGMITYVLNPGFQSNTSGMYGTLIAGTYTITATDANNCSITTSITISGPPALQWGNPVTTNVSCNGGSDGTVSIVATGGTPTLSYTLQPGAVTNSGGSFTSLSQGSYTITVSDANNCTLSTTISITEPPVLNITNVSSTTPSCVPGNDGSLTITAVGGTPAYQYNIGLGNQGSNTFSNLGGGIYTITVADGNGCTATSTVSIIAPNAPNITTAQLTAVSCNGGSDGTISLTTTGGSAPLSYNLQAGNITNGTGFYTNLSANSYTITVTDGIGCSISTIVNITEPTAVQWDSVSQTNVSCYGDNDGSLSVSSSGGTGMITYVLNPGFQSNTSGMYGTLIAGTYTITATDANNCSITTSITISGPPALQWGNPVTTNVSCNGGSDGTVSIVATGGTPTLSYTLQPGAVTNSGGSFTSLSQGSYTITVSDANNCTLSTTISITEPPVLNITNVSSTTPSCVPGNDGSLTITAVGGTPAYQYNIGLGNQGSNTFSNLGGGIYTITVADGNGCTATSTVSIIAPNAPNITTAQLTAVSCNGGSDGTISLTTTGGSAPLSYNLQAGNITNGTGFYTNLSANSYTITVTDGIGCSISTIVNITEPTAVQWDSVSQTNVSCYGDNDGSLSVSSSGGTGMITYVLNPGFQSNTSGMYGTLIAGTYTITATDANNCSITTSITISGPPALQWGNPVTTNVSCNGGSDGTVSIVATGGTLPFSYNLTPGNIASGTGSFLGLTAGTYTNTVTDSNGCTLSSIATVSEPLVLQIDNIGTAVPSCVPGNDGTITIVASGGTPMYQYSIGNGNQSNNVFSNVSNGTYTVTVTDANGCSVTSIVNVMAPNMPMISNIAATNASCIPGGDGSLTVSAINGQAPYLYAIGLGNQTSSLIANVAVGTYTVTVTDASGCTAASTAVVVNEPSPTISIASTTDASCIPGCDGMAMFSAVGGGNPTYTYSTNGINFQSNATFSGLCANSYVAIVRDGNGCTDSANFVIATANGPVVSTTNVTTVSCNGGNDGTIAITAINGANPLNYNLLPGNISNGTGAFIGLSANAYSVTITDANGCTINTGVTVNEPLPVIFDSVSGSGSSCSGSGNGNIVVVASGGTNPIGYSINPNATFSPPNTFTNLAGNATYVVTATDGNGCSLTTSVYISSPVTMTISNAAATNVSCNGGNDGSILLTANGGTLPYNYNLQPSNLNNAIGSFNNLTSVIYTVTATDANNCTVTTILNVTEPLAIQVTSIVANPVTCYGDSNGSIQVAAAGGVGQLSYNLQPSNVTNTSGSFNNLSGANYTVTITDANNCSIASSILLFEPASLMIDSLSVSHVTCSGADDGSIVVHSSGGNGGNQFFLQPVSLTNSTGLFTNLVAQQYLIAVTDTNGCYAIDSMIISEPSPLTASQSTINVRCSGGNDGSIDVTAFGGTPGFTYTLLPNNVFNNTGYFNGLSVGTYDVVISDANSCSTSVNGILISEPPPLQFSTFNVTNIECYGANTGRISAQATGGINTTPLSYAITPISGNQTTPGDFVNLYAGTYTITVSDANNCIISSVANISQNPQIYFDSIVVTTPICYGEDNGTIVVGAHGGWGNILYSINNGAVTSQNRFVNLRAGGYYLIAMDTLGCVIDSTIYLSQPEPLAISDLELSHLTCEGAKDGIAVIEGTGGVGYLTYYVRPGVRLNRTGTFTDLDKGYYRVKIVDTNKCEIDTVFTILQNPNLMTAHITKRDLPCRGIGNEGEAEVEVFGGVPPLSYAWSTSPVQQSSRVTELRFGLYGVTVTDANGCKIQDTVYINPGECCQELFLPNAFSPNGDGRNDEFRVLTTAGIELLQFEVFNRWGQKVWNTFTYHDSWNGMHAGEPAPVATYYYVYRYRCSTDNKEYIKKGDLILIR